MLRVPVLQHPWQIILRRVVIVGFILPACSMMPQEGERVRAEQMEAAVLPMAATAVAAGQLETARRLYGRLLEVDPDSAAARMGLGDIALEQQEASAAANWYLAALEHAQDAPQRHAALLAHGRAALAAGRLEAARESFARLSDPEESAPSASAAWGHNGIGLTRLLDGDARGAVVAMERAVLLFPEEERFQANLNRALTLLDRGPPPALTDRNGTSTGGDGLEDLAIASGTAKIAGDSDLAAVGERAAPTVYVRFDDRLDDAEPAPGEDLPQIVEADRIDPELTVPAGEALEAGQDQSKGTDVADVAGPGEKALDPDVREEHLGTLADADSVDDGRVIWVGVDTPEEGEAVRDLLVDLAQHGYEFEDWSMLAELANGSGSLPTLLVIENDERFLQAGAYAERYVAETLAEELHDLTQRPVDVTETLGEDNVTLHRVRIGPLDPGDSLVEVYELAF